LKNCYQFHKFLTLYFCTPMLYLLDQLIRKCSDKCSEFLGFFGLMKKNYTVGGLRC